MSLTEQIKKVSLRTAFGYLEKNPEENAIKLLGWVDKLAGTGPDSFESQRAAVRRVLEDPTNNMYQLTMNIFHEIDPGVLKATFENFFLNANIIGWPIQEEHRRKYGCNIPWAILLDPTSACNLHCTGCWAAEYGNKLNLSFEELDDIMCQGKNMGVYFYLLTGGEPMVRKKDIIKLCEKHDDCVILAFTNGTLIDDEFAEEMLRVKNFIPCISIEGFSEATDSRRGVGVYDKVMHACDVLRRNRLPFGFSCCYTSVNFKSITSKEFLDSLKDVGAFFTWFFHYMPVGNDASPELLPTPEQRVETMNRVRKYRAENPLFIIDFQNDGEYVNGCIAGGRRYLHINANGDIDPCAFIHYSDSNIREKTLLEAMQSPLFMAYHRNMPFNDNYLKPCPMLENPDKLPKMVKASGAHSTDLESPESAEHFCGKTVAYAKNWDPVADKLWAEKQNK